jgi:PKD repeat protein
MGLLTQPAAAFSYELQGANEIQFTNLSLYAYPDSIDGGYYSWDFGDGSPPYLCGQGYAPCTGNILTHQYAAPGVYTVTLTAIVCTDTSVVQALIDTQGAGGTVGIAPQNSPPFEVVVYPNPAQNTLQITTPRSLSEVATSISLYTLTGQLALQTTLVSTSSTNTTSKTISVAHLPAGVYVCRWQQPAGGAWGYVKVVVVR